MLFGDAKDGGMDVDTVVTIKMATDVPPPSSHHLPEDLLRCTHTQSHRCTHKHTHTHALTNTHTHTITKTHTQKNVTYSRTNTHTLYVKQQQVEFLATNIKNFPPLLIAMWNPYLNYTDPLTNFHFVNDNEIIILPLKHS